MKRRRFLQTFAFTAAATTACSSDLWIGRTSARSSHSSASKRLIVILLRGAVDGLNVVIPYQEPAYYQARPSIAIPKPGELEGALDLDGFFGLHPALSPLLPFWQQKSLAFVHASGSSYFTRSHFDAQTYMENGTPGHKTADGWMNRLMAVMPSQSPIEAVSVDATLPRIFQGPETVINFPSGTSLVQSLPLDNPAYSKLFDRLYHDHSALGASYQEGRLARQMLRQLALAEDSSEQALLQLSNSGTRYSFAANTEQLAALMVKEPQIQLAFLSMNATWDTHVSQGGSTGQLATSLTALAEGLKALAEGLGPIYGDTAIVVMSEFGRTVEENRNRGTDHGYGNIMWLLGGSIRGGKVYGDWRGLNPQALYQERFLPITTDFRDPLSLLLQEHLGVESQALKQVFPEFTPQTKLDILV